MTNPHDNFFEIACSPRPARTRWVCAVAWRWLIVVSWVDSLAPTRQKDAASLRSDPGYERPTVLAGIISMHHMTGRDCSTDSRQLLRLSGGCLTQSVCEEKEGAPLFCCFTRRWFQGAGSSAPTLITLCRTGRSICVDIWEMFEAGEKLSEPTSVMQTQTSEKSKLVSCTTATFIFIILLQWRKACGSSDGNNIVFFFLFLCCCCLFSPPEYFGVHLTPSSSRIQRNINFFLIHSYFQVELEFFLFTRRR